MTDDLYKALLEATSEIVIVFDADGAIRYGNPSAREKLLYTEDGLQNSSMVRLFRQEFQKSDSDESEAFCVGVLQSKEETVIYQERNSCIPVSVRICELGESLYLLLAEDISWKKDMESRIRKLKEEEQTNQTIRNEFTANVTHELRTPVNGIKGHVLTLLEQVKDAAQRKTLEIILFCCDNMSSIISNILDFSKIEAGKFTLEDAEFDFYEMMDKVIETHMAEIRKKELGMNVYIGEDVPRQVIGDSLRVGQILNNLLSNAIKFTKVGRVSVEVSKTHQTGDVVELFFMVRDSGIGISKEDQDKLFQSFKQVDASVTRRYGGTGLGLSITKQLVEMMGGMVRVDSEKGKGSCFSFNIKLKLGQSETEDTAADETIRKWNKWMVDTAAEPEADIYTFGTEENIREINLRMEKLVLAIELGSWDKAEMLADTVKSLTDENDAEIKRVILRLEMALRKENYDKSTEAYMILSDALKKRTEG